MLASVGRRTPSAVLLPFLFPLSRVGYSQTRGYAQQRTARTPRSTPRQSTTKPSPTAQVKNRSLPSSSAAKDATSVPKLGVKADEDDFKKLRQQERMREMEKSGEQLEIIRLAAASGVDPFANKAPLLDLRIPPKITSFSDLTNNWSNNLHNMLSMYRLAYEFAFPGIITKWRVTPQLFRAKSTSDNAWVAPFRLELLDVYKRINKAIASGDKKTLKALTAYEYQAHAYTLLQKNLQRQKETGLTALWNLHHLLSPVQILSLRAFPMYTASEEPKHGNRLCVQAVVRFESLQTLLLRDPKGRILTPDGKVVDPEKLARVMNGAGSEDDRSSIPEPKRVLEYLVCENKMFYPDGWYVRDQMFEALKPKFKESAHFA